MNSHTSTIVLAIVLTGCSGKRSDLRTERSDASEGAVRDDDSTQSRAFAPVPIVGANLVTAQFTCESNNSPDGQVHPCAAVAFKAFISLRGIGLATEYTEGTKQALGVASSSWEIDKGFSDANCSPDPFHPLCSSATWQSLAGKILGTLSVRFTDGSAVSTKALAKGATIACPTGFVAVPANPSVGVGEDFCVMKYEAKILSKDDGASEYSIASVPDSRSSGTPWVGISRDQAITACQSLNGLFGGNENYDLVSNAQWQAIARNIESVASNWLAGVVGIDQMTNNGINQGHSNNNPTGALAASSDDNESCIGTNQSCSLMTWTPQRRTHRLSNDEIIWDLAGNVWEWVKDNSSSTSGADDFISKQANAEYVVSRWGPLGNYQAADSSTLGLGFGFLNHGAGSILRGGAWDGDSVSGIFAAYLSEVPSTQHPKYGLRCVFVAH